MPGRLARLLAWFTQKKSVAELENLKIVDRVMASDAQDAVGTYKKFMEMNGGELADVVINVVNVPDTEMASVMCCKERGKVYFFSMATSFTKAALGAEGIGKDVDMIIGNGYAKDHAKFALEIVRENKNFMNYSLKVWMR
jgi:L-erythro-3,5-diaminohexanoate dehydrogenase (EC 1.4.1.11)